MPVDPQIQAILDRAAMLPGTHTLTVAGARARYEALVKVLPPAAGIAGVAEREIDGPGGRLRLRIYTPEGSGKFPAIVFELPPISIPCRKLPEITLPRITELFV